MTNPTELCFIVGARPNFVKAAPLLDEVQRRGLFQTFLVHTGQHYDHQLSDQFFEDLEMPEPDLYLGVGSGTHAVQTAAVMAQLEPVLAARRPACVVVFGDVNSTVAASLTAAKLHLPVAHVEAGLRSFDRRMPEEINRMVTDVLSDVLFTTEASGTENLHREGVPAERIHFVGNLMVDSQRRHLAAARRRQAALWEALALQRHGYAALTLHRPSNVDDPDVLARLLGVIGAFTEALPVIFPAHPRTRKQIEAEAGLRTLLARHPGLRLVEPLGYLEFLALMEGARLMLTDSGGIQEETTALGVPCLTLRANTERPVTLTDGTNRLVGTDAETLHRAIAEILAGPVRPADHAVPPLWDGQAAARIADVLEQRFLPGNTASS